MGLLSSIGSFLVGGSKKSGSATTSSTTNNTTNPWAPAIPFLTDLIGNTANLYTGDTQQISDLERAGHHALYDTATSGGTINNAIDENNKVLSGAYLTPDTNPYLADIAKRISGIAGANSNATFGGRGRSTGGLAGYYNGKAVGDSLTDMYGTQYNNERNRMTTAIGAAPGLETSRYIGPQAMIEAGKDVSMRPYQLNSMYASTLGGLAGLGGTSNGTSTGKQQNYTNSNGLLGSIFNSFTNKLFGTSLGTS